MRILLIILPFVSFAAKAQVPFVLGKSYPIGYVVTYPTSDIKWISKVAVVAKTYPVEGPYWTRHGVVPQPVPSTSTPTTPVPDPGYITRATVDSVYRQINATNAQMAALSSLLVKTRASIDSLGKVASDTTGFLNLKYSLFGTPLINMIDGTTGIIRSLEAGEGISLKPTQNTIIVNKK